MNAQFRKPWFIVATIFVLIMTVWVRMAEYRMPLKAAQLEQKFIENYESVNKTATDALEPNEAFELYKQAKKIMTPESLEINRWVQPKNLVPEWGITWSHPNDRFRKERGEILLPLPLQPVPEETLTLIHETVDKYRPALEILRRAAKLPLPKTAESLIDELQKADIPSSNYYVNENISRLLLLASIGGVLENNEEEAIGALEALRAYIDGEKMLALVTGEYPYYYYRLLEYNDIREIMIYGLERHIFSEPTLDRLDALLDDKVSILNIEFLMARYMHDNSSNEKESYQKNKERYRLRERRKRMFPLLGDGLLWYGDRISILDNIGNLTNNRYVQHCLLAKDFQSITSGNRRQWLYPAYWLHVTDPYDRIAPISFEYLAEISRWQYYMFGNEPYMLLIRLSLAAEKYRRHEGMFPEKMIQLVPKYMSVDSLNRILNENFVYERTETGWKLLRWGRKSKGTVLTYPIEDDERWKKK